MHGGDAIDVRVRRKAFALPRGPARVVLRDVAFTAHPGEILAVLGRSGTGKSTLLRLTLGLDRDFEGTVFLPRRRTGVVFQEPRLLPWLTVAGNLRLVVTDTVPEPDIPALLDAVGLAGAAGLLPRELSLGMARRAAIARALAVDPAILVLDEPFVSLDRRLAGEIAALLARRARQHHGTMLLATHDLDQALAIADRILVLHGHPATLAADLAVPDPKDGEAAGRFKRDLLARFAFLDEAPDDALAAHPPPRRAISPSAGS
jgi:NitT/TauT family transport system ATP-binding protein